MKHISIAVFAVAVAFLSSCGEESRATPQEVVESSGTEEMLERNVEFEPALVVGQPSPQVVARGRNLPHD